MGAILKSGLFISEIDPVILLIRICFDWFGGVEQLRVLQIVPWFDPGGHKPSILTPLDSLDNLLLHPPAQPGDMVLVDKPSVRGHKLRKELGVLVIWLRATARGKSSWTQDASRRCWTVRVLHGDRHVCFRGRLDRVLQLVLRLLPSIFGVSSPRQWGGHHHRGLLPPRPLRYNSQNL